MFWRKLSLVAAIVLVVAVAIAMAQPQVTIITTNGQRHTGTLVYRNNTYGLMTTGGVRSFPARNVAVIEFAPGDPNPDELTQVSNNGNSGFGGIRSNNAVLVLQDGQVITGSQAAVSQDGNQISIVDWSNQRNNYQASDVARLYLNPSAAQNLFANNANQNQMGAVGTSGQTGVMTGRVGTLTIAGNQHWTPTGLQVRQGERLMVRASGQIKWGPTAADVVGPQGGGQISPNYPVATAGVGALIGRVGNGQAFLVPSNGETITMPASGELFLGINDDLVSDNAGSFQVQIARTGR